MKNFNELKNNVGVLSQRKADTDYLTKIGVWINLAQDFLFNVYDEWIELQDIHNFSTVASTEDYFMPTRFDKPLRIFDITNNKKLDIETEVTYFESNIANVADANEVAAPQTARLYGSSPVTKQISASGDTLQVKSSSSSDTGAFVVRVEGFIDSSRTVIGFEDITISTSTPTTFVAGSTTFYQITHVSKSGDTVGFVTVADSSSNTLVLMSSIDRVMNHKIMKLGLIPSQANSMRILFKKKNNKLVNDNDYPFVDADGFLIMQAAGLALIQDKDRVDLGQAYLGKAKEELNALLNNRLGELGPDYQNKMVTSIAQAHRM